MISYQQKQQQQKTNVMNISSINPFKQTAKSYFLKQQYIKAIQNYQLALKNQEKTQQQSIIYLNIGICFWNLNLKRSYYENVQKSLELNPKYVKAHYHRIKSIVLTYQHEKNKQIVKESMKFLEQKDKKYLQALIKKVNIARQKGYEYSQNWIQSIKNAALQFQYFNVNIEVKKSEYGLGLFAKGNLPAHKIIIVERPMVFERRRDKQIISQCTKALLPKIKQLLDLSQEFRQKFSTMCRKESMFMSLQQRKKIKNFQQSEIKEALDLNCFEAQQLLAIARGQQLEPLAQGAGLYQKICLINHRCQKNCDYSHIGQYMIVRTVLQIKKGDEIFIGYKGDATRKVRQSSLKMIWNIDCKCIYCIQQEKIQKKQLEQKSQLYKSQQLRKQHIITWACKNRIKQNYRQYIIQNPQFNWIRYLNSIGEYELLSKMIRSILKQDEKMDKQFLELFKLREGKVNPVFEIIKGMKKQQMMNRNE